MCGIAGIVDPALPREEILRIVRRMVDTLVHRGPDDDGYFADDGVGLGIRRLSIIDVAGGHQPLGNEDGRIQAVCNGELYNFADVRARLQARGHTFRTGSDVEIVPHAYEEFGIECLSEIRGMFGLALWDGGARRLLLARDRLGKKPLFYSYRRGRLLFGSEIKALLAADPELAEENEEALAPYFRFGFVPEPMTAFRHVWKLPAAHRLVHQDGNLAIEPYWELDPGADPVPPVDHAEAVEELDRLLEEAVRIRLVSDVPLGIFLSGGLDSSTIVAYAHRSGQHPLKTFTIGFDRPSWDESPDAQLVADHFGTDHHVLVLREEDLAASLQETIFTLVRHCDEPFGDSSALPTYFVSKLAREHVTVILGGDGGDEIFLGYSSYRGIRFAEQYRRLPAFLASGLIPGALGLAARWMPAGRRYGLQRAQKVLRDSVLPFEQMYAAKQSVCRETVIRQLFGSEPPGAGDRWFPPDVAATLHSGLPSLAKAGFSDLRFGLVNDMLVKVDRMSMASSLEVRTPLLDHRLVEFVSALPPDFKLRGWQGKAILRDTVGPALPRATLRKRKQGFAVPLREWLRTNLNEMVGDYLEARDGGLSADIFDRSGVRRILREHRGGEADHSTAIWLLLIYATWHDLYLRNSRLPSAAARTETPLAPGPA